MSFIVIFSFGHKEVGSSQLLINMGNKGSRVVEGFRVAVAVVRISCAKQVEGVGWGATHATSLVCEVGSQIAGKCVFIFDA